MQGFFFFPLHATRSSTLAMGACLASARPPFVSFQGHLRIRVHDRDGSLCPPSSNRAPLACTPLCNPHNILRALHHLQSLRCTIHPPCQDNPSLSPLFPFPSKTWRTNVIAMLQIFFEGEGRPLKPPDGCNRKNHPASPGH